MTTTADNQGHIYLHLALREHPKLGTANTCTPAQGQTVQSTLLSAVTRAMSFHGFGFVGEPHKATSTVNVLASSSSRSASAPTVPFPLCSPLLAFFSLIMAFNGTLASADLFGGNSITWDHQSLGSGTSELPTASSESRAGLDLEDARASSSLGPGHNRDQDYFKVEILLFVAALSLGFKLYNRRVPRQGILHKATSFLSTMALLTSISLLLTSALLPSGASGHNGEPAVPVKSLQTASTTIREVPQFTVPASADFGKNVKPNIEDSLAVDPQVVCPGYSASNVQNTKNGFTADLDLAGPTCNVYGNDVEQLSLLVEFQANERVHLQIEPRYISKENATWFQIPEVLVPKPQNNPLCEEHDSDFVVSWSNDPTFYFTVKRKVTGDTLFTTEGSVLVYEDQFIEFVSPLPKNYNLYGLGEVIHGFRLGNNLTRTLFAADVGNDIDYNIYGSHPVYLDTRYFTADESGQLTYAPYADDKAARYTSYTHGVYLRNAHPQEVLLREPGITWRTIGGSIDLYFYSGPRAEDVTTKYQESAVGLPAMQQYWTLGYHQCRWGYTSWQHLQEVIDNFAKFDIPLETVWADIDYMKKYRDFENDPQLWNYTEGKEFMNKLHKNHQHWVPIVDSAIYAPNPEDENDRYPTYERGLEADVFVKNPDGSIYYGAVWPGYTVFPDWVGAVLGEAGTIDWWMDEIARWRKNITFDGIWIDMSEVASFCVGSCGTGNLTLNPAHPPFHLPGEPGNLVLRYPEGFEKTNRTEATSATMAIITQSYGTAATAVPTVATATATEKEVYRTKPTLGARNINWPPYAINNYHGDIAVHALSPNATHNGGYVDYDFHNLYGHQILNATYQALLKVQKGVRPFIIGRSTFAGSGKWAGHWGGDNESLWAFLYFSIPQALSFSLFGFPMFGVDTCGFNGNTNYELCSRWMQLSAFFPFYRNHNAIGAISQEPYVWSSVIDATKSAMAIRYALLPYIYTLMTQASLTGSTVMRALAWEFPNEPWLADADRQFMLGDSILVTPCLEQGAETVDGVFPGVGEGGEVWYDWYTHAKVSVGVTQGQNVTIEAKLGHIPVYVRGGKVVPTQEPGMTTTESRMNPWGLLVGLDGSGWAEGRLYLDDGVSLRPEEVSWVSFTASNNFLKVVPLGNYPDANPLRNATVMGLEHDPKQVWLNGEVLDQTHWSYDAGRCVLDLFELKDKFPGGAWIHGWEITWE